MPKCESCASGIVVDHCMGLKGKTGRRCPLSPTCAPIRTVRHVCTEFSCSDTSGQRLAKVSTHLLQCDELAAQLRARQSTTESLLTALIHRILEGGG